MSKKLSQSEIDALVASLLAGEGAAEETPAEAAQPAAAEAEAPAPVAAPERPSPASQPAAAAPVIGLTPENMPFDLVQDLGPIAQSEVEAAIAAYQNLKSAPVPVAAPHPAPEPAPTPAAAAAMVAQAPAAPAVAMPPSNAAYAAGQAQAAHQTRKALSMAALGGVLMDIELTVTVQLGRATLSLGEVLALGPGSVVTLDKLANAQVDVLVNRVPMAKAEVLAIGEKYGVRITQSSLNVKAAS